MAHATPRSSVKLFVTRQLSCTKGRKRFQRRPVVAPKNVWSWIPPVICPRRRSAAESPVAAPKIRKKPSWKALVSTFIWLARIPIPTRMSCLPRIMSKESEMENTLVPPWKGANPRSPRDQYPPDGGWIEVSPQLMQYFEDWFTTPGGPPQVLSRLAFRMPILLPSHVP